MLLVTQIYSELKSFPREKLYVLSSQIKRYAASITSNIAEGCGKNGTIYYWRFFNVTPSSLFELQTQLEFACNLELFKKDKFKKLYKDSKEAERLPTSLNIKIKNTL
jgi:four helix bundle protein